MSAIKKLTADFKQKFDVNDRKRYTGEAQKDFKIGCIIMGNTQGREEKREENIAKVIKHCNFDIFILEGTFLRKSDFIKHAPSGYDWARNDRKFATENKTVENFVEANTIRGGGQLIYVRQDIDWEIKSEGEFGNTNVQYMHIEITQPTQLHLIAVYGPKRGNNDKLVYTLMSWYIAALPAGARVMFIGDVNIDWFNRTRFQYAFSETLADRGIHQLIRSVTSETGSSGKCVDHIYTNVHIRGSGVETSGGAGDISADHNLIKCITSYSGEHHRGDTSEEGKQLTIDGTEVFILCKLQKKLSSDENDRFVQNRLRDGGYLALACPDVEEEIKWVNEINRTNAMEWCNIFHATQDMVERLREQLPTVDFTTWP